MNTDIATLQSIADTLKEEPLASQRILAKNAGMSIGLMNAVLKRFVERGWIMFSNVNLRKLSYAITPEGISELTARSHNFAKHTFELANKYNEIIYKVVQNAKNEGKSKLALYGKSNLRFLLIYACQTLNVSFLEKEIYDKVDRDAFCVVGELCEEVDIKKLEKLGCVNILYLIEE